MLMNNYQSCLDISRTALVMEKKAWFVFKEFKGLYNGLKNSKIVHTKIPLLFLYNAELFPR